MELADRMKSVLVYDARDETVSELGIEECAFTYRSSRFKEMPDPAIVILGVRLLVSRAALIVDQYPDVRRELTRLGTQGRASARAVAEAVMRVRRRKLPDPRRIGNVGSFFKNPVVSQTKAAELLSCEHLVAHAGVGGCKLSAAQLIDLCGWKGSRRAGVGVWQRQPLVLVNLGGAHGADFLDMAARIRRSVEERFGVTLELEPRIVEPLE